MTNNRDEIARIEKEVIDKFLDRLAIRHYPKNLAQWAILTFVAGDVQREALKEYGGKEHKERIVIASRSAALLVEELEAKGKQQYCSMRSFSWNRALATACKEAITEVQGYFIASACYPFWHQEVFKGEMLSATYLKFTTAESEYQRQVTAYQKGFRPRSSKRGFSADLISISENDAQHFESLLLRARRKGANPLDYPSPTELYSSFYPWFLSRAEAMVRRKNEIAFGLYNIEQLKSFIAALQVLCAIYDHLLYLKGLSGDVLMEAYVIRRRKKQFVDEICQISGLSAQIVEAIIADSIFSKATKSIDLHYQLFVSLDSAGTMLAILPQFALSANYEENLMRTLSRTDPHLFNTQTDSKELQLIEEIKKSCRLPVHAYGPYVLPDSAGTNIDLVIVDETDMQVLIIELKWIRKPIFVQERKRADMEFVKGSERQLPRVRAFLQQHAEYLKDRGATLKPLSEYCQVAYLLVGRDHLVWPESMDSIIMLDFDVLKDWLCEGRDLKNIIDSATRYEWLPKEGIDFQVKTAKASVNGITIECPSYSQL